MVESVRGGLEWSGHHSLQWPTRGHSDVGRIRRMGLWRLVSEPVAPVSVASKRRWAPHCVQGAIRSLAGRSSVGPHMAWVPGIVALRQPGSCVRHDDTIMP